MATTVAGLYTHRDNPDAKAVNVTLNAGDVVKGAVVVAEGWLGVAGSDADSGESLALALVGKYQFHVPAGLSVTKGTIVYVTLATITGHYPDDEAYTTSAGVGKVAFFKATADKDANNMVEGIMLARNALAS